MTDRATSYSVCVGLLVLLALTSCAKRTGSLREGGASGPTGPISLKPSTPAIASPGIPDQPGPGPDWNDPIPYGVGFPSLTDAATSLAFTPVDPSGISSLKGIYVSNPQLLPPDARSIAFVFGDETMARSQLRSGFPRRLRPIWRRNSNTTATRR